jgi:hypothetical protein
VRAFTAVLRGILRFVAMTILPTWPARRHDLFAALLFVAISIAMTWPLAAALDRAVANPGDPFITEWVLDWDWYATFHQPLRLFEANAFYPAHDSLAFSEHLYGLALLTMPLRAVGIGPMVTHNIALLLGFAFTGFGTYLLTRRLSGSVAAALAAGIFFAFVPFRFTQLPHLQTVWSGWLPILLLALLCYASTPTWRSAALFGGAFLMNALTNVHWFLFGSLMIALTLPIVMPQPRAWVKIAAATAVALLLLLPFLLPYISVSKRYGMTRTVAEVRGSSASPKDWLNPGVTNRFYRRLADVSTNPECWLFPGVLSIALSAAGIAAARHEKRTLAMALLWLAAGVIGSFGIHAFFHRFLFGHVPGFRAVRTPSRWANVAYLGMAMLIAFGVAALSRKRQWPAIVVAALFLVELRAAPIRWHSSSPNMPEVYRWIAAHPVRIVELPIDAGEQEYTYMRWSTFHHRPMVNGVSGFVPRDHARIADLWQADPIPDALVDELQKLGIDHVVVHGDWMHERESAWLRRELIRQRLSYVDRFPASGRGDWVFAIGRGRSTAPELEAFLGGEYTYNNATFGFVDAPNPGAFVPLPAFFSGWALSPWGVKKVDLLFDNGQVRLPTTLLLDKRLIQTMPWYDATVRPRFVAAFDHRPPNIRPDTDLQVEITDGQGAVTWLEGRSIDWQW